MELRLKKKRSGERDVVVEAASRSERSATEKREARSEAREGKPEKEKDVDDDRRNVTGRHKRLI